MELNVTIEGGMLRCIYSDAALPLMALGKASVTRASHVEFDNARQHWFADMRPVGGEVLAPFTTREEALATEVKWLQEHRGL
jgi:hypothetical protein